MIVAALLPPDLLELGRTEGEISRFEQRLEKHPLTEVHRMAWKYFVPTEHIEHTMQ